MELSLEKLPELIYSQAQNITKLSLEIDILKRDLLEMDLEIINKISNDSSLSNETKRNTAKLQMQSEWTEYRSTASKLENQYNQLRKAKDTYQYYRDLFDVAKLTHKQN